MATSCEGGHVAERSVEEDRWAMRTPNGSNGKSPRLRLLRFYSIVYSAVIVPDLLLVFVYSAVLLGPDVYNEVANDSANAIGNGMALVSGLWMILIFVFDMFDSTVRGAGMWAIGQIFSLLILVVLIFTGFTFKAVAYPWVPVFLCACVPVFFLAFKRDQWRETIVCLPHFYLNAATSFSLSAAVVLLIWLVWIWNGELRARWWDTGTRDWLADTYAAVYSHLYKGVLDCFHDPDCSDWSVNMGLHTSLYWYCSDEDRLQGVGDKSIRDKITSACTKASTVCFVQWAGPFVVVVCNILCAGFCVLFSNTIGKIHLEQHHTISVEDHDAMQQAKKKALMTFMKRFMLTIVLAIAVMYTSLYVSGAAATLSSAMLAVAAVGIFVMFLWLCREVDTETLAELKAEVPMMKNIISIVQSNWVRAIAVGGLHISIPLLVLLDKVRQKVRILTGYYRKNPHTDKRQLEDVYTSQGRKLRESLELWNWTDIFGKVCVLAEIGVLLVVGAKATFIFFSFLNGALGDSGLGVGTITVMVWAIGLGMFMNPIVPGSAVYLFAGVVVGAQSQKAGSVGIWAGLALACIAGTVAKLIACLGQYSIGYYAGKSVRVQQFVGVTKVATLASEAVLKEPGFRLFKVCILVAGPDFPTSMLCGILKLSIPQMLLGTCPVILVSIIPQTLVGVLLTKQGDSEGVWGMVSMMATGLAALFQAGATLVFSYGIMKTVEEKGDKLLAEPRPEHAEVRALTEREAEYVATYRYVSDWQRLGLFPRVALLGAVAFFLVSGFTLAVDFMATEKICFRKFSINSEIGAPYERGGLNGHVANAVYPAGWLVLALTATAVVLHISVGKWLKATARASHAGAAYSSRPEPAAVATQPEHRTVTD